MMLLGLIVGVIFMCFFYLGFDVVVMLLEEMFNFKKMIL